MEIVTELDFEISCEECGRTLNISTENLNEKTKTVNISVKPCQSCLNKAEDKGYESGQKEVN